MYAGDKAGFANPVTYRAGVPTSTILSVSLKGSPMWGRQDELGRYPPLCQGSESWDLEEQLSDSIPQLTGAANPTLPLPDASSVSSMPLTKKRKNKLKEPLPQLPTSTFHLLSVLLSPSCLIFFFIPHVSATASAQSVCLTSSNLPLPNLPIKWSLQSSRHRTGSHSALHKSYCYRIY